MIDVRSIASEIQPLEAEWLQRAQNHLDQLTKPPGSLGKLEHLAKQLVAIRKEMTPRLEKKAVIVMAADHGVCDEGISQYPQAVTGQMILNFLQGGAAVNVLARQAGADVFCYDIGSKADIPNEQLHSNKIRNGTGNIAIEPAMSEQEAELAIMRGVSLVHRLVADGYTCFATGEMGIGNTTVSSALLCVLLEKTPSEIVGFGTGIDATKKLHKELVVQRAIHRFESAKIKRHEERIPYALELLAQLGGLEIAGLVGVILGCAYHRCPIVIDGFISTTAAVVAAHIAPNAVQYMVPSHLSHEAGHRHALAHLELQPMLHMDMRLGEGTGAVLCFPLIDVAIAIICEMATFESAGVSGELDS